MVSASCIYSFENLDRGSGNDGFSLDGLFWKVHAPKWCPKMSCIYLQDHHFRVFSRIV